MARPFLWFENFEAGTTIATATSGALVDYPHYTELARLGMHPFRGAYCMRIRLNGGTTSQYIREDTAFDDLDDAVTRWFGLWFYLGKDLIMAASDKFALGFLTSTTVTVAEVAFGIVNTAGVLQFWVSETAAAASSVLSLGNLALGPGTALGKWYYAEFKVVLGASAAGTIDAYLDETPLTQITGLSQANIVDAEFGVIGPDAGTSGTVLIDDIVYDDLQNYRVKERFTPKHRLVYGAKDHPIIGPGCFSAAFSSTGTDAICLMYDTDAIPTNLDNIVGIPLKPITAKEAIFTQDVLEVQHGLYTVITGTATDTIELNLSIERGGMLSEGQLVSYGRMRGTPHP